MEGLQSKGVNGGSQICHSPPVSDGGVGQIVEVVYRFSLDGVVDGIFSRLCCGARFFELKTCPKKSFETFPCFIYPWKTPSLPGIIGEKALISEY